MSIYIVLSISEDVDRISVLPRTPLLRQGPMFEKTGGGADFSCCVVYCCWLYEMAIYFPGRSLRASRVLPRAWTMQLIRAHIFINMLPAR